MRGRNNQVFLEWGITLRSTAIRLGIGPSSNGKKLRFSLRKGCNSFQYEIDGFLGLAQHRRVTRCYLSNGYITPRSQRWPRHPFLSFCWEGVVFSGGQIPYWYVFPSCSP